MRQLSLKLSTAVIVCVMALAILNPGLVQAAGNVLLPSSSGNSSYSAPSLGIVPAAPAETTAAPVPVATPDPVIVPAPTVASQPVPTLDMPPAMSMPATNTQDLITSPVDAQTAAHLSRGQSPTQIIHVPDASSTLMQMQQNLPYSLTIGITGQSIFGANDIKAISSKLGLSASQIPSACIITTRGVVSTSKGSGIIAGSNTPQVQVRYDGVIQGYFISALALCAVNQLAPGLGLVSESGGRYQVPLQSINCPAPTHQVSQLNITYTGDSKTQCAYQ